MIRFNNQRLPEGRVPDAFESIRRLFRLVMLPTGALACALAWSVEVLSGRIVPFDFYFLPIMGTLLAVSAFMLWRRPQLQLWVEYILFIALIAYLLITLEYQLRGYVPKYGHFNAFAYWYFLAFLIAFITWKPRQAVYICAGIYTVMLALLALNLQPLLQLDHAKAIESLNNIGQFYFACLAYMIGTYMLAQLRSQFVTMQQRALTDPLTGAANRRHGEEILALELDRANRYGHALSVIMLDLDHFKRVNDTHGHAVGDIMLCSVARTVDEQLRTSDHLARWGGEEFLVIAPELDDASVLAVAERIRTHISHLRIPEASEICPSASFGVAFLRTGDTPDTLFARADQALYRAKNGGRNQVVTEQPASVA
ncbi:sensor domain-containing diguanylate cyclase [Acidihalobacter ferrooxydans]|uniref:diguanylate cyclase n=1 Tax=Acidihalobacter ferrooxydans TaxID=1765967 RepID=A0A1P8UIL5_9GAMM|nr:GGDEF domain-containing protein [Acidihalobacter ferrooxydans]APZ43672.1 hypothetical protein BW247_11710 [Acidihalobacter ferrooxydans]